MGFKKGAPKPEGSGRKKGTPNRSSLRLIDDLEDADINLVSEFVEASRKLKPEARIAALERLFRHVYPVLKEIEAPPNNPELAELAPPAPAPAAPLPPNTTPAQLLAGMFALASTKDGSGS